MTDRVQAPGWSAAAVLSRELGETRRSPGLLWLFGTAAVVPAVVVIAASVAGHVFGLAEAGPALCRAWFLPAFALVGALSAAHGAGSIAGRAEPGVLDAMRRHGVAVGQVLAGKLGAAALLGLGLFVATIPASLLPLAFGSVPALDLAFALLGVVGAALLGPALGVAIGATVGEPRRAIAVSIVSLALSVVALAVYARLAPAAVLGSSDWSSLVVFGSDPVARRLDVYARLAMGPLLAGAAIVALCRAVAVTALSPRRSDRLRALRPWIPGALAIVALAAAFVRL